MAQDINRPKSGKPKSNTLKSSSKAGLPPGTLKHIGKVKTNSTRIVVLDYSVDTFTEKTCTEPEECFYFKDTNTISWINVDGLHDVDMINRIGSHFNFHPLMLEDILNTNQRPKIEEFENCMYVSFKMLGINEARTKIISEQVSIVMGDRWLISFQEKQGDIFDGFRRRVKDGIGIVRKRGTDYLLYRLIDIVVDNYFFITEFLFDQIELLEDNIMNAPDQASLNKIQSLKKKVIYTRKSTYPLQDVVSHLRKDEGVSFLKKSTLPYLSDLYDHQVQINDSFDICNDMLASLMDLSLSAMSNNMNQVMKTLTIIATIFIPLTFIAGIYGMNFSNMPELQWKYGYFIALGVMFILLIGMLYYFRKNKWL